MMLVLPERYDSDNALTLLLFTFFSNTLQEIIIKMENK